MVLMLLNYPIHLIYKIFCYWFINIFYNIVCVFRGRMNGGGDINSLGLLPDKLKTELAIHVNLETLKKVSSSYSVLSKWSLLCLWCCNMIWTQIFSTFKILITGIISSLLDKMVHILISQCSQICSHCHFESVYHVDSVIWWNTSF